MDRLTEAEKLLKELLDWDNSPEVKGAFESAWIHGYTVSKEFSDKAGDLWKRVKNFVESQPKEQRNHD